MYHGNRKVNILYTRLRHKCSTLSYDLYRSNLIHDPTCSCGNPCENSFHYIFECPLYTIARRKLLNQLNVLNQMTLDILEDSSKFQG